MLAGLMRKDAACLVVLGATLLFAPAAHAGTYVVSSCQATAGGGVNHSWTLEPYNSIGAPPPAMSNFVIPASIESCSTVTALTATTDPATTKAVKNGDGLAFVFRAPAGNTVTSVSIDRFMEARPSSASAQTPAWLAVARAGTTVGDRTILGTTAGQDYCDGSTVTSPNYCLRGTENTLSTSLETVANLPVVQWGFECQTASTNCVTGNGAASNGHNAEMQFQGAQVVVDDPTPPVLDAGSPTDGWHRPQDSLTAEGTDGGGLKELHASIDGTQVASAAYTCDYHFAAPCPTHPQLAIPLAGLADGQHGVTVTGVDAGSNGGRGDRVVDIDGTPPTVNLVPTRGGRTITFAVSDALSGFKAGEIAIRPKKDAPFRPLPTTLRKGRLLATVPKGRRPSDFGIHVAAIDNAGNVTSGQTTSMTLNTRIDKRLKKVRNASATVPYKHEAVVTGRLTTVDGVPLAGQQLLVTSTMRVSRATPQLFRSVTTSPTGRFSFRVSAGPSRKLDISYVGGPDLLHRTRSVTLHVPAHSTIRASRKTVFGAATVRFAGHLGLLGARLPAGGKIVVLEAQQHARWTTVDSTRAKGPKAAWHAVAHFRGNPGTFPVRLRIPREGVFAYDTGHSPAVKIRVL